MKKLQLLLVLSILLIGLIPFASASTVLNANLLKYEPIPAQPGQYVTAYIEIQNIGNEDAPHAAIQIEDQFPFQPINNEGTYKDIGLLKSHQSYVETFTLRVNSQAIVGNNKLKIKYTADKTNAAWQETEFSLQIKPNEASLSIIDVTSNPEEIAPGEKGEITIRVKNSADIVLRAIGIQLGLVTVQGSSISDLPFIPTNSATEKKINRLNVGEIQDFVYTIQAYPDANPGYYKLPLAINFYDDEGTQTESQDYVGIIVKAKPELKVYLEDTSITGPEQEGKVTLQFVNKGINNLKFLDVELLNNDEYDILSTTQNYIGDLDSDDYRSETFTIKPHQQETSLDVQVSFKDENNKEYSTTIKVPLQYNKTANNSKSGPSTSTILLIILVLVLLIVYIRKRMKRKKTKR